METVLHVVLLRLASLKITMTVLVMAIILVMVGTLAQVDQDVWQVVDDYFRASGVGRAQGLLPPFLFPRGLPSPTKSSFLAGTSFPWDSIFQAAGRSVG